jgi:hypothetical protein
MATALVTRGSPRDPALDALIVSGHALDRLVGIRELTIEMAHDGEEWGDQREQGAREGEGADPRGEGLALPERTRYPCWRSRARITEM